MYVVFIASQESDQSSDTKTMQEKLPVGGSKALCGAPQQPPPAVSFEAPGLASEA